MPELINSSQNTSGRLGNILFRDFVCSYISKQTGLKYYYKNYTFLKSMGIRLHKGTKTYNTNLRLTNTNVDAIFDKTPECNIEIGGEWQTPIVAKYIRSVIVENNKVIKDNNNNLFVHVRLDGIFDTGHAETFEYYDKAIQGIKFDTGFISSDSINHEICTKLIDKYNLKVYNSNEINTIKFGSSCKNIVLSKGTFSWWIGVFSFDSNVYYPVMRKIWHGSIFIFPDWFEIDY